MILFTRDFSAYWNCSLVCISWFVHKFGIKIFVIRSIFWRSCFPIFGFYSFPVLNSTGKFLWFCWVLCCKGTDLSFFLFLWLYPFQLLSGWKMKNLVYVRFSTFCFIYFVFVQCSFYLFNLEGLNYHACAAKHRVAVL
jgi:hypothetical protein